MRYRPEIDGLRAIAVVPVILFHAGFNLFSGGFVGVDVFFVISGYLITTIIVEAIQKGNFELRKFYERRARRILPALFLVVVSCVPFAWLWLTPNDMKDFAESIVATASFSSNILFWRESGYFDQEADLKPLLHTWSLAVEEQYYILFPLFLISFWRFGRNVIVLLLVVGFLASLGLAQWGAYNQPVAAFYLLPTRIWELLLGVFCGLYLLRNADDEIGSSRHALSLAGLAFILVAVFAFDSSTPWPSVYALVPTLGAALIIIFARGGAATQSILSGKYLVGIGLISYSAYLWHQPMFAFLRYNVSNPTNLQFVLLVMATFVLAYLSWKYVEKPFRSRTYLSTTIIFRLSAISILSLITLGTIGIFNNGNYFGWSSAVVKLEISVDELNKYVWSYKNAVRNKPFTRSNDLKILVVGDSNSGDLLNALWNAYESKEVEISSLEINSGCGNLFLPANRFVSEVSRPKSECRGDRLLSEKSLPLLQQADVVIFASDWADWEANLLTDSNNELVKRFGNKFWYFGVKHNNFSFEDAIDIVRSNKEVRNIDSAATEHTLKINAQIRQAVGNRFVDPIDILCPDRTCPNVDKSGNLIFYDGFHLSPLGAKILANRLRTTDAFNIVGLSMSNSVQNVLGE